MNEPFDLIVRNAHVATAADLFHCDIGVRDGRIAALADHLPAATGTSEIDAAGRYVTPGGVDSHCHLDQPMHAPHPYGRRLRHRNTIGRLRRHHNGDPLRSPTSRAEHVRRRG